MSKSSENICPVTPEDAIKSLVSSKQQSKTWIYLICCHIRQRKSSNAHNGEAGSCEFLAFSLEK